MQIQILNISVQTLNWFDNKIVDWCSAGKIYTLNGETKQLNKYHFGYKFDSAINSADGQYVFLFERLGTKGLLIKNGEILREINRSYYMADVYDYPAAFINYNDKVYLAHCPVSYRQLDFEHVESGEIVTNTQNREPSDIFHSRLEVSNSGKYLMSKGWVWHPIDVINVFEIKDCFLNPNLLDKLDYNFPDSGSEICTASFINDTKILAGSSAEVIDDEKILNLPSQSFAIWNIIDNTFSNQATPEFDFGNLFSINETLCWDIYKFPKIIDLTTGLIIDKAENIYSGEQKSSILFDNDKQPQVAFDKHRKRLAIKQKDKVVIVTRE
ncbi:MAG: hypothetical protein ABI405_04855 [Parafilimonas sp.]